MTNSNPTPGRSSNCMLGEHGRCQDGAAIACRCSCHFRRAYGRCAILAAVGLALFVWAAGLAGFFPGIYTPPRPTAVVHYVIHLNVRPDYGPLQSCAVVPQAWCWDQAEAGHGF